MLISEDLMTKALQQSFYARAPSIVARDLLGKLFVRKLYGKMLEGRVVETEAYFGLDDPASRAFKGKKNYNSLMWGEPGCVFIYNVHKYWMLNIVAHEPGKIGAVLIRAIEPTKGTDLMFRNRPVKTKRELTNGPGKLTLAMGIDKTLQGETLTNIDGDVFIHGTDSDFNVGVSRRIGVTKDLEIDLRYYIIMNPFVSR